MVQSNGDSSDPYAIAGEYFTVAADDRSVSISSGTQAKNPDVEPNSLPNPQNPFWPLICDRFGNQQYVPGPELVNSDGSTNGDTTYSDWTEVEDGTDPEGMPLYTEQLVPNWQYFTPVFSGGWLPWGPPTTPTNYDPNDPTGSTTRTIGDPAVTWNWGPGETQDWEMGGQCEMPAGYILAVYTDTPTAYNVSYTATTDYKPTVSATAKCKLTVHNNTGTYQIKGPYDTNPKASNATETLSYPAAWADGQPAFGGSDTVAYGGDYALYGPLTDTGVALTGIGTIGSVLPGGQGLGPICIATGLLATTLASEDTTTVPGVSMNSNWPGVSTATGISVNQWVGGVVPTGVTSNADSGNYTFTATPYGYQKFANFLYGVDSWGTGGYESYSEEIVATPITGSNGVYFIWTATAQPSSPTTS